MATLDGDCWLRPDCARQPRGTCAPRPALRTQIGNIEEALMASFGLLHYAVLFLVVAVIAAAVGFGGVAGVAVEGARLLFWVFVVLFVLSLVAGLFRRT
jgi:uncharacterized membrane protein YtjA (UPF0391 family)